MQADPNGNPLRGGPSPPGRRLLAAAIGVGLVTIYAFSTPGGDSFAIPIAAIAWFFIAVIWLVRVVQVVRSPYLRRVIVAWAILATIPMTAAATYAVVERGVPIALRFGASRDAFDRVVANLGQSETQYPGWVGFYAIDRVDPLDEDGVWFLVSGGGVFGAGGFAYSPAGQPQLSATDEVNALSEGWWTWRTVASSAD